MPRTPPTRRGALETQVSVRWALLTILTTVLMGGIAAVGAPRLALGGEAPDLLAASTAVVSAEPVALFAGYVTSIPSEVTEFETFVAEPETDPGDTAADDVGSTPATTAPPAPVEPERTPQPPAGESPPATAPTPPPSTTVPTPPTTVPSPGGPDASAESSFVSRINGLRTGAGQPALARSGQLDAYARAWAEQMAASSNLSHSGLGGGPYGSFAMTGENVGVGGTVDIIFSALAASGGHVANMTHPGFTHVGVGVWIDGSGQMWTAHVFGG